MTSRIAIVVTTLMMLLAGLQGPGATAASPVSVRGTWQFRITLPSGATPSVLITIRDQTAAGVVTGTAEDPRGSSKVRGKLRDDRLTLVLSGGGPLAGIQFTGTLRPGKRLTIKGDWSDDRGGRGSFSGTLVKPSGPKPSRDGGTRPSATLVICDRDMTGAQERAALTCVALVTDAAAQPESRTPTGSVDWETEAGELGSGSCSLSDTGGGVATCVVTLTGTLDQLPIGSRLPVTATYAGDRRYAPSDGAHQLFGQEGGLEASDQFGPDISPASARRPCATCGDPVNPATGNLSLISADIGIAGRGPALAVVRTYNALAAAAGATGRYGAGWSDEEEARLTRDGKDVSVMLGTGATVPFRAKGKGFGAPGWVTATLTRQNDKGYVLTFVDQTWLHFDREGTLVSFGDRARAPVTLTRNGSGAVTAITDDAGRSLTFELDAVGRVVTVTDPVGRTVGYTYDDAGDLVAVTDVSGGITRYGYDSDHRMTSITDARGSTAATTYDADGRVAKQTDPLGSTLTFEYLGAYPDGLTIVTDGLGTRTAFEFQGGALVADTQALDGSVPAHTRYLYDSKLRQVGTVDPNGGVWRSTLDRAGNVLTATDPLGRTTSMVWSKSNDLTGVTSPTGVRDDFVYDDQGRLLRAVAAVGTPAEAMSSISYDDPAHPWDVTAVTDATGAVTRYEYDRHGNVTDVADALSGTTTIEHDPLGWVTGMTDPLGGRTTLTRDARGEVTSLTDPMGHVTTVNRDAAGVLTSITDALGTTTSLSTDAAGRRIGAQLADGSSVAVDRNELGDIVGQSDAAESMTATVLDPLRRVASVTDALGHTSSATHDAVGNVLTTTDALGQVTRFTWDAANELLAIDYEDGTPDVAFSYDEDGRRTSMTDGTGTTTYAYDARDNLVSTTDGAGQTVGASWDLRGDLTTVTYPDGLTVSYARDPLGRVTAVTDSLRHTSTFAYDAAGRLLTSDLGDGSTEQRSYDAEGSLASISGGPLDLAYERDPLGRIAQAQQDGTAVATTHDVRGRLTDVGVEHFAFDAAGALTSLRDATLTYDLAGRLLDATGADGITTFTFDDAGRRLAQTGTSPRTYVYDQAGRLTSVGTSTWSYDGDGLRRSVTDGSGSTSSFQWLEAGDRPLLLSDGADRFIYGPGGIPLTQVAADGTTTWLHTDQTGSVRAVTDDTGAVVGTSEFDAYGLPKTHSGSVDSRLGFQGNYTEPDTGLQYLLARVYDPGTGQFLTVDPAVMQTLQPYAFAAGDPLTYADPTGLDVALAGHGAWFYRSGVTKVPPGTTVVFHGPAGFRITDGLGILAEQGSTTRYEERHGPGSIIPDYTLMPPDGLQILKTSRTVSSPKPLSMILEPNQGEVHWAACRGTEGHPTDFGHASPDRYEFGVWTRQHGIRRGFGSDGSDWGQDTVRIFGDQGAGEKWQRFPFAEPAVLTPGV